MSNGSLNSRLEQYRPYLRVLARVQVDRWLRGRLDASDLVQQALLEAVRISDRFEYRGEAALAAWLRQLLAHQIAHAVRDLFRDRRDVRRQQSLEQALEESAARLEHLLAEPVTDPAERFGRAEQAVAVAAAIERLPLPQREAILLHYWQGYPLAEVARRMSRTTPAVAGLLQRGLKVLRQDLKPPE